MSDTFDPVSFLSAVSGDGDWSDEFLAWYEPGKWLSDELACAIFVAEKFIRLRADRDSWYQQHSDRVDDAVRFAAERDAAQAECAALRAILDKWSDASHLTLHAGEMTAQELRTVRAVVNAIKADIHGRGAKG